MSTDELTGAQALERKHPGLPLVPGKVQRREFEYTRHGTRALILSRDVVTGKMLAPHAGPTRTEEDFLAHVQAVVATDPQASRWHVVCDNLNIHQSESLVRWVAFLSDPSHKVVFHYTPQSQFLDESNRDLAFDPGPQAPQTWFLHLGSGSGDQSARFH